MDPYDIDLEPPERAIMMIYRQLGSRLLILLITAGSILLSVLATLVLVMPQLSLSYPEEALLPTALGIAIAIPLVVAPATLWMLIRVLARLDNAYLALLQLSTTDPLTGAANRRGFFTGAGNRLRTWQPSDSGLVGMVDLDAFKSLNDRFGHPFGDQVLQAVAQRLQETLGEGIVGRLGGDEFAFLILGSPHHLDQIQQTLRTHCSTLAVNHPEHQQPLTISTSMGMVLLQRDETLDQGLARADRALYSDKRQGRRGEVYVPAPPRCRDCPDPTRSSRNRRRSYPKSSLPQY